MASSPLAARSGSTLELDIISARKSVQMPRIRDQYEVLIS
jgi:hypothetical protein